MILAFESPFVSCADAIEGQIVQVTFDTVPSDFAEEERKTPYVLLSRDFEFPDRATVEWHDGRDYDGGAEVAGMTLQRNLVVFKLDRDLEIKVNFQLSQPKFARLTSFLRRMIDDRIATYA
jgi:hypothetical protein